jgi:hypothetical protein
MASELTNWQLFHLYRRLVEQNKAVSLICPNCNYELITRIGVDDEPILWCYGCLSSIRPGSDVINQVRAVVTEHYT